MTNDSKLLIQGKFYEINKSTILLVDCQLIKKTNSHLAGLLGSLIS